MIKESTRHISVPFMTFSNMNSSLLYDPIINLVTYYTSISAIRILPSKYYQFKNFRLDLAYHQVSAFQPVVINNSYNFSFKAPSLNITGLSNQENASYVKNLYSSLSYRYNGILNNPDLTLQSYDSYTSEFNIDGQNTPRLPNYFSISASDNAGNAFAETPYYPNTIERKSSGTFSPIVITTEPVSGGLQSSVFNFQRSVPNDDFNFENKNYNKIIMFFSPIASALNVGITASISGYISFDLIQSDL